MSDTNPNQLQDNADNREWIGDSKANRPLRLKMRDAIEKGDKEAVFAIAPKLLSKTEKQLAHHHNEKVEKEEMRPEAEHGKTNLNHLRTIAPEGGKTHLLYSDEDISQVFRLYKKRNHDQTLTSAINNIITKREQYLDEYLEYKNAETVFRRLNEIARPLSPVQWWKSL